MRRRKLRSRNQEADLDITAFMNLMIVLVPILLINMVFAATSVLDLNFPLGDDGSEQVPEDFQLQVVILNERLIVSDNKGGVIKQIPGLSDGSHDFEMLGRVMQDIKSRVPSKKDITLMAKKKTSYQTLVTVMDKVRAYRTSVDGEAVNAELFPDISIADAPQVVSTEGNPIATDLSEKGGEAS